MAVLSEAEALARAWHAVVNEELERHDRRARESGNLTGGTPFVASRWEDRPERVNHDAVTRATKVLRRWRELMAK